MEFVQASAGAGRDTAGSGERREKGRLRLFAPTKSRALLFMFGYFPDLIFLFCVSFPLVLDEKKMVMGSACLMQETCFKRVV
jgi:hypothetical protein